MYLYLVVG